MDELKKASDLKVTDALNDFCNSMAELTKVTRKVQKAADEIYDLPELIAARKMLMMEFSNFSEIINQLTSAIES
jgi:hypothetical protein